MDLKQLSKVGEDARALLPILHEHRKWNDLLDTIILDFSKKTATYQPGTTHKIDNI